MYLCLNFNPIILHISNINHITYLYSTWLTCMSPSGRSHYTHYSQILIYLRNKYLMFRIDVYIYIRKFVYVCMLWQSNRGFVSIIMNCIVFYNLYQWTKFYCFTIIVTCVQFSACTNYTDVCVYIHLIASVTTKAHKFDSLVISICT